MHETAELNAERIIVEEVQRLGWRAADLPVRHETDPAKLAIASRLRCETTVTVKWIADRLHLGSSAPPGDCIRGENKIARAQC